VGTVGGGVHTYVVLMWLPSSTVVSNTALSQNGKFDFDISLGSITGIYSCLYDIPAFESERLMRFTIHNAYSGLLTFRL